MPSDSLRRIMTSLTGGFTGVAGVAVCLLLPACSAPTEVFGPPPADLVVNGPPGRARHRRPPSVLASAIPGGVIIQRVREEHPDDESYRNSSEDVRRRSVTPETSVSYGKPAPHSSNGGF